MDGRLDNIRHSTPHTLIFLLAFIFSISACGSIGESNEPTPLPEAINTPTPINIPTVKSTPDVNDAELRFRIPMQADDKCRTYTADAFYAARYGEYSSANARSKGRLGHVLQELPYGDCSKPTEAIPSYGVTTCENSIGFTLAAGFTSPSEYFSTLDGSVVAASFYTDMVNAFCNGTSSKIFFGEIPTNNCESTLVTYCKVVQEDLMVLYEAGKLNEIGQHILENQP